MIAARRAGVQHVILPKANEPDYSELPQTLREDLTVHFAAHFDDVYKVVFAETLPSSPPLPEEKASV